jgi:hypothetical protein
VVDVGQGEAINVPDVGERLVLRVGSSPLPQDDRLCAFVEKSVAWALNGRRSALAPSV